MSCKLDLRLLYLGFRPTHASRGDVQFFFGLVELALGQSAGFQESLRSVELPYGLTQRRLGFLERGLGMVESRLIVSVPNHGQDSAFHHPIALFARLGDCPSGPGSLRIWSTYPPTLKARSTCSRGTSVAEYFKPASGNAALMVWTFTGIGGFTNVSFLEQPAIPHHTAIKSDCHRISKH